MSEFPPSPFYPVAGQSSDISATGTSSSITLAGSGPVLRVVNAGLSQARIRIGTGTVTALTTDSLVCPGIEYFFSCPETGSVVVAAITGTGSATVNVTRGRAS